jgi:hypothetical protein
MRSPRDALLVAAVGVASIAGCYAGTSRSTGATAGGDDGGPTTPASVIAGRACPPNSPLTYASFGEPFFTSWCTGCHSSQNTGDARRNAPVGYDYDTLAGIRQWIPLIYAYAADGNKKMPAVGGPSDADRQMLGDWLACGAPGTDDGYTVTAGDGGGGPPLPTGACANPYKPLPAAVMPRCSVATRDCMMSCTDQNTCPSACLGADVTPADPSTGINCTQCFYDQVLACADPQCHVPTAEYVCCVTSKCPTGNQACIDQLCNVESETFSLCLYYAASNCLEASNPLTAACFGAGGAVDAGAD